MSARATRTHYHHKYISHLLAYVTRNQMNASPYISLDLSVSGLLLFQSMLFARFALQTMTDKVSEFVCAEVDNSSW